MALSKQMELFEDGGLKDEGGMVDEVSGNDVPIGSTREEVRDDIPAQLSEGEFVFPADVVRYIGLEKLMKLRQEAKQGLKQMEAMGQMGNSEEATMPDDLPFEATDLDIEDEEDVPFDESDLDIEDDLEYNIGGYVPPSYTPPVIPNTPQINIPQIPTQPGIPSVPGFGQPTAQPKLAGFEQLTQAGSPNLDGQSPTPSLEMVRYYNEDTKQVRMIPHLTNPDGSRAETLYPVPEGFAPKAGDPVTRITTKKQTSKGQETQPRDDESGDDGGKGPGTTAVDPAGDALGYQSLLSSNMDPLDKAMQNIGNMQKDLLGINKLGISGNVMKQVVNAARGKSNISKITLGVITNAYTKAKIDLGIKGKNIADIKDEKTRNKLANTINRAINTVKSVSTKGGKELGTKDIVNNVNKLTTIYGLTPISTKKNYNLDKDIKDKLNDIEREREKVRAKIRRRGLLSPQQGFDMDEALGLESLSAPDQKAIMEALESGKGVNEYGGVSKDTLSDVQSIAGKDQYSFDTIRTDGVGDTGPTGQGDPTAGLDDFKQGGLLKKKPKVKKMKRGGLASKK